MYKVVNIKNYKLLSFKVLLLYKFDTSLLSIGKIS